MAKQTNIINDVSHDETSNALQSYEKIKGTVLKYDDSFIPKNAKGNPITLKNTDLLLSTSHIQQEDLVGKVAEISKCIRFYNLKWSNVWADDYKSFNEYCEDVFTHSITTINKWVRCGKVYTKCTEIKGLFDLSNNSVNQLSKLYDDEQLPNFINYCKEKGYESFENVTEAKFNELYKGFNSSTEEVTEATESTEVTEDEVPENLNGVIIPTTYGITFVFDNKEYAISYEQLTNYEVVA